MVVIEMEVLGDSVLVEGESSQEIVTLRAGVNGESELHFRGLVLLPLLRPQRSVPLLRDLHGEIPKRRRRRNPRSKALEKRKKKKKLQI